MDVLACAIAEIIWRCAGGFATQSASSVNLNTVSNVSIPKAIVTLPQEISYLQHSVQYFQDGLTETVRYNIFFNFNIFRKKLKNPNLEKKLLITE